MMKLFKKYTLVLAVTAVIFAQSCQQPGGETTGSEFMPDMSHSIAYEANYYNYYYNNTWGTQEDYHNFASPKQPVKGTIPRQSASTISIPKANGSQPYHYIDTEEDRTRAIAELVDNPFSITEEGLVRGKELYDIMCSICHGEKGNGEGYLVRDGGVYPVQPAILTNDEFIASSNGRFYHSIMFGKNLMGSYRDKLSYEERWQVIHYIRSLQAKEKKLDYNQLTNTLNNVDRPAGVINKQKEEASGHHSADEHDHHMDAGHHDTDDGGDKEVHESKHHEHDTHDKGH